eukprot:4680396-Amphidinium_carterae.1
MPIYDDSFIDHELDKQNLSSFETDRRRGAKLRRLMDEYSATNRGDEAIPQAQELPEDYEPFTEEKRKTTHDYKEAFTTYSRLLQYTFNKSYKVRTTQACAKQQSIELERIRGVETTTRNIPSRTQGSTTTFFQPNHEPNVEQHNSTTE